MDPPYQPAAPKVRNETYWRIPAAVYRNWHHIHQMFHPQPSACPGRLSGSIHPPASRGDRCFPNSYVRDLDAKALPPRRDQNAANPLSSLNSRGTPISKGLGLAAAGLRYWQCCGSAARCAAGVWRHRLRLTGRFWISGLGGHRIGWNWPFLKAGADSPAVAALRLPPLISGDRLATNATFPFNPSQ
jgi:hypothetical protein